MIRLWGAERQAEEKGADGWIGGGSRRGGVKVGPAALRAADRLLMVFVCPGPVPVQGADSPGCYIKELWVFRGLTWAGGHIN